MVNRGALVEAADGVGDPRVTFGILVLHLAGSTINNAQIVPPPVMLDPICGLANLILALCVWRLFRSASRRRIGLRRRGRRPYLPTRQFRT